jgi:hypothetical protein
MSRRKPLQQLDGKKQESGSGVYGMGYLRGSKMATGCPTLRVATPELAVKPFQGWAAGGLQAISGVVVCRA